MAGGLFGEGWAEHPVAHLSTSQYLKDEAQHT